MSDTKPEGCSCKSYPHTCHPSNSELLAENEELRKERDALLQIPIDLAKMDSIDDEDGTQYKMTAYYWWKQAQEARTQLDELRAENERLTALLNTPEVEDWAKGVMLEAGHQRERWGVDHDTGKSPFDWFWLVGYLAQKAAASAVAGNIEKAKHHTISTGAALANWHLSLSGVDDQMRPGIDPEREQAA